MPIQIPSSLPAMDVLESENIFVMTQERAIHQDIRPLKIIILNLKLLTIYFSNFSILQLCRFVFLS